MLQEGNDELAVMIECRGSAYQRHQAVSASEREAGEISDDANERGRRVAEREKNVTQRERETERASRQEARQYLLEARAEVERTIRDLKAASEQGEEAAREARKRVESLANEQGRELDRINREPETATGARSSAEVSVGDFVAVDTLGGKVGRVVEVRDGEAVVALGVMKLALPRSSLRLAGAEAAAPEAVAIRGDLPDAAAPSEIDLRGMRVGDVEGIVMHAVDAAIRADLKSLRIIHGKGTGALRERVTEMLRKESRVTNFRLGAWNEGGAGVTIVELG